ncbi:MAG TPA: hypothetical protein VIY28_15935 [Pseudonocardiaceae bacterium]
MAPQMPPESGREDDDLPWSLTPSRDVAQLSGESNPRSYSDADLALRSEWGARPGESDPGRMLCWVLLIVAAAIILALVWWLVLPALG